MISRSLLVAAVALFAGSTAAWAQGMTVRVADWAQMPFSGNLTLTGSSLSGNPTYMARVNFLREEPGNTGRVWICDLNGSIHIVAKSGTFASRSAAMLSAASAGAAGVPYLDFNGTGATELTNKPNAAGTSTTAVNANGIFPKFTKASGYANGLVTLQFDPGYPANGKFYTIHIEGTSSDGSATRLPSNAKYPGFNTAGYTSSGVISGGPGSPARHAVLIEWTDTNPANATFEGTAREVMRLAHTTSIHPMGDLIFNPLATTPAHPEWGMMYVAIGDGGSGESNANDDGMSGVTGGDRHFTPERLDLLQGKVIRIIPDLSLHTGSSTVSANGRYRIPNANPFATGFAGARKELWTVGHRNPHRFAWDAATNRLVVCEIGFHEREEINILQAGGHYGYASREGVAQLIVVSGSPASIGPLPSPDTLPVRLNATTTQGTVTPIYPAAEYSHSAPYGDAIANGFVYRGSFLPQLQGKFVFGDITTGRLFYCEFAELLAAHDGVATTLATLRDIRIEWDNPYDAAGILTFTRMFEIVRAGYQARGGTDGDLPGGATISGTGRADIRLAMDAAGELYITSKSDGFVRAIIGVSSPWFSQQPASATAVVGQAVPFTAAATGTPPPSLRWERRPAGSGTWSLLADGPAYSGTATGTLTVTSPTLAMSGDAFRCVATNGTFENATSAIATLTVITAKTAWLQQHFSPAQIANPAISGDAADPERDGLNNALEYGFALNPWADSNLLLPRPDRLGGLLRVEFDALRSELDYIVEACTELAAWSTVGVVLELDGIHVTATFDPGSEDAAFMRLRIVPKP